MLRRNTRSLGAVGHRATGWLARHSVTLLRLSLGAVFLAFGLLKFFPGLSPAAGLAGETFAELTLGLVPESVGLTLVATLETAIGLSLLTGRLLRLGVALLGVAMVGVLSPLVLLPEELFRGAPWAPTLVGQYVLKDVVLLAAALAVAASAFGRPPLGAPSPERPAARVDGRHPPEPVGRRPSATVPVAR
jgi:putative oxidoreductase